MMYVTTWFAAHGRLNQYYLTDSGYTLGPIVSVLGLIPNPRITYWVAGVLPLLASILGLGLPLLRGIRVRRENRRRREGNARLFVRRLILRTEGRLAAKELQGGRLSGYSIPPRCIEREIRVALEELGGSIDVDPRGGKLYLFPRVSETLSRAAATIR